MDIVLVLLIIGSLIAMVVGLVKPTLVIRWGETKSRLRVLMVYGGLFLASFVVLGIFGDEHEAVPAVISEKKIEETKVEAKEVVAEPEKVSEVKYTYEDAKKRFSDWLGDHIFPDAPSLSLSPGTADGSMIEVEGKKYHMIVLKGLRRAIDVLVDPNTGEMFFYDTGVTPVPIDRWYVQYRNTHGNNSQNNARIDKYTEWVQTPTVESGQLGYNIVGVVKNISKTSYSATLTFNLYDGNGNMLGTATASIDGLQAGGTWKFSAPILKQNVAKYEFKGISYGFFQ